MGRWFAVAAALLVAILLHTFYVDYEINAKSYLVGWPATASQRDAVIDRVARSRVRPPTERLVDIDPFADPKSDHINRYCDPTERYYRLSRLDRAFTDPNDEVYFRCSKKFVQTKQEQRKIVTPGLNYVTARTVTEKEFAALPMRFGMVPSRVIAGGEPSRTSFVKSYWLGVLVPAALMLFVLFMLISAIRGRGSMGQVESSKQPPNDTERRVNDAKEILGAADAPEVARSVQPTLADLLKSDFGPDFPVSGGNGKEDSPLVITATTDYVSVEYAAVRHMLAVLGEEYKLSKQALLDRDGKQIDKLIFNVKKAGSADWEGQRSFYFDITAGFRALG